MSFSNTVSRRDYSYYNPDSILRSRFLKCSDAEHAIPTRVTWACRAQVNHCREIENLEKPPEHLRHKPQTKLARPREIVLVCPAFKSVVNLSRIVRLAGCAGIERIIACGTAKVDPTIARDGVAEVKIEKRRSLVPVLKKLKTENYQLVGLEQTDRSQLLYDYKFVNRTALVIGHERYGIKDDELPLMNDLIEIPVYGLPFSYNVVTATTMAVYEYCRQFPTG